ncbi:MAG: TPM domain-containing protein [Rhizobiaceae bacterium]
MLAVLAAFMAFQAIAQSRFPPLTGRVVDTAGILSADAEQRIAQKLRVHETATGEQIVVATIPSLDGADIETYTLDLAREWAIGTQEKNDGVVFLIAKNDRRMRIEVGYGLEDKLTDAAASLIIRLDVAPEFRKGEFEAGIERGVDQMLKLLEATDEQRREWESRSVVPTTSADWSAAAFLILFVTLFVGAFGFAIIARIFGRKIKPGHYKWLGMDFHYGGSRRRGSSGRSGGGWSGGGGGFSGGGGSFGGGGSSGSW